MWLVFCAECCSCFPSPQLSHLGRSPELSSGQSSLIECVPRQTESDDSGHLEWHSPPPHDGLTTPQATSHVMSTSWQSAANTFFTLWHLQSSSDFCSQLPYIACKLCYELREKKMRPDKVKTITSVMKPLLGRGDNEGIFSRNLVSINHGEPPHSADVLPPSISAHSTRVWSAMLGPLWSLQWSVWPGVSYAGHGDQVSPMLRCPRKWKYHGLDHRQNTGRSIQEGGQVHSKSANWLNWMFFVFVIYGCPSVKYCTIKSWMRKQLKLM